MRRVSLRVIAAIGCGTQAIAALFLACAGPDDGATSPPGTPQAGAVATDATTEGAAATDGAGPADGAREASPARDANGPGEAGTECIFNRDCQSALRCSACDGGVCVCEPGARGIGKNGMDTCEAGDDCASALCVEGPDGAAFYCSDECTGSQDCTGMLPTCETIDLLGQICIR